MTTTEQHTEPAAWIGCLSCYNRGTLRGKWITARQAANEADANDQAEHSTYYAGQAEHAYYEQSGIAYARCVVCGGDEFDVFDTMNLGPIRPSVRSFYRDAEQLADLDDDNELSRLIALAGWLGSASLADLIEYDADNYGGQWSSWQEFADNYADDFMTGDMPQHLAPYFDYEKYARDLAHSYYYDDATGHVWHSA